MSDNWDEPFWSPVRLYHAWRMWMMYLCAGTCRATLCDILTYYRRHEADYRDHGPDATIF